MSAEELEYKRAALQILSSILGELVPDFWKTLTVNGSKKGDLEYRPSTAATLSTNFQKWPPSGFGCAIDCTDRDRRNRPMNMVRRKSGTLFRTMKQVRRHARDVLVGDGIHHVCGRVSRG